MSLHIEPHNKIPDQVKQEKALEIFELMRTGDCRSFAAACKKVNISTYTINEWIEADGTGLRATLYARARAAMHDAMADEILSLADSEVPTDASGRMDNAAVQKLRLQIDTRKWLLSKLAPKKYGDKLEISGSESAPLRIERVERVIVGEARRVIEDARQAEDAAYIDVCASQDDAPADAPALPAPERKARKPREAKRLTVGEILERDAARRAARPPRERKRKTPAASKA